MKILITGATGMVGSETVRRAISQNKWEEIILLVRTPVVYNDPRVRVIVHQNFLDYNGIKDVLSKVDTCIWCLGIPQAWATKEEYHTITFEYTVSAAKALQIANDKALFLFVSGGGADSTEKSRITFAREKGMTENALKSLQLKNLTIVRPGGIYPIMKPVKVPFSYKLFYPLFPLLNLLLPGQVITSVQLAEVLLYLAQQPGEKSILENKDLKKLFTEKIPMQ